MNLSHKPNFTKAIFYIHAIQCHSVNISMQYCSHNIQQQVYSPEIHQKYNFTETNLWYYMSSRFHFAYIFRRMSCFRVYMGKLMKNRQKIKHNFYKNIQLHLHWTQTNLTCKQESTTEMLLKRRNFKFMIQKFRTF